MTGFGIVGTGLIAPFHANAIRDSQGGQLIGFYNRNIESARSIAEKYNAEYFQTLEAMIADPRISVICVTTPNHVHVEPVLKAAAAGKHILLEKPPAITLSETDKMVKACQDAGVLFGCTVQCRVRAAVQAVKAAVEEGRFGRILHADAYMKWYRPEEYYHSKAWRESRSTGGGVTIQHAFHYIDLLQYLVGPVKRVDARMTNLNHPGVNLEDTLSSFLEYANGARGVVQASTSLWPGTDIRIEINGEKGTAIISGETIQTWSFRDSKAEDEQIRLIGSKAQATAAGSAAGFGHQDHGVLVQNMIDSIQGKATLAIPVATVRHTLEICLAMYRSDRFQGSVDLPYKGDSIDPGEFMITGA